MSELYAIEEERKVEHIIECYKKEFSKNFGSPPDIPTGVRNPLLEFVKRWPADKKQIGDLVAGYFALEDKWIREQGYPINFFPSRINAIITSRATVSESDANEQKYVLTMSEESGMPMCSPNPNRIKSELGYNNFKPVLFDDWINLSTLEERLQLDRVRWGVPRGRFDEWKQTWKDQGYGLPE